MRYVVIGILRVNGCFDDFDLECLWVGLGEGASVVNFHRCLCWHFELVCGFC